VEPETAREWTHEWKTAGAAGYEAYSGEPDTHWYTMDAARVAPDRARFDVQERRRRV
jgi:hypothetical protein